MWSLVMNVEPQVSGALPHSALIEDNEGKLRQHQPEANCSSPITNNNNNYLLFLLVTGPLQDGIEEHLLQ